MKAIMTALALTVGIVAVSGSAMAMPSMGHDFWHQQSLNSE